MKLFNPIYDEENCNNLQQDLTSADKWTETSQLKFHPDKCCNMRIGHSSIRNDGYAMGNDQNFDSSLNFEACM